MTERCYRGCGRPARWLVGDPVGTTAWPVCTRHIRVGMRVARRWARNGVNTTARIWRAR